MLDQIAYKMGSQAETYVEIVNCFIGDENSFRSFIPGFTNPASSQNFPLAIADGPNKEFVPFWLHNIHIEPIEIEWGEI